MTNDAARELEKWLHHKLAAAQNQEWEEGDECAECLELVSTELMPLIAAHVEQLTKRPPDVVGCDDCPAPYGTDGWCDVVIPNEIWNAIAPEGGLLCFRCMTKRLEAKGYTDVPVLVASGPYKDANETWRLIGLRHGEQIERERLNASNPQCPKGHPLWAWDADVPTVKSDERHSAVVGRGACTICRAVEQARDETDGAWLNMIVKVLGPIPCGGTSLEISARHIRKSVEQAVGAALADAAATIPPYKGAINVPCSACSAGDTKMEHHSHEHVPLKDRRTEWAEKRIAELENAPSRTGGE